jgi:hypothetical protein
VHSPSSRRPAGIPPDVEIRSAIAAPPSDELTFPVFLALHTAQIDLLIFDFNDPRTLLFLLRIPDTLELSDLKAAIAREAHRSYDSSTDAMELYGADSTDLTIPARYPLRVRYTKPSFLFSRGAITSAMPIYRLYFNIVPGISEADCADTLLMTLHICEDGYTVGRQAKFRVRSGATIAQFQAGLIESGIIDATKEWRYAEEWSGRIYNIYQMSDTLTYNTDPIRVEVITKEQERISVEKGDLLANGCSVVEDEVTEGSYEPVGYPFHVPVFAGETLGLVKERMKKGLEMTDDVFKTVTVAVGDLYKPVTWGLEDDAKIGPLLAVKDARLYLIYGAGRVVGARPKPTPVAPGIRIRK